MENIENNQVTQELQPVQQLPPIKDKNIFKYLFIASTILFLSVIIAFYFLLNNKIKQLENKQIVETTPVVEEISTTPTKSETTPAAIPTTKSTEPTLVEKDITVKGKVCYPSDFIPNGYILAKNIQTNKIESFPFTYESKNQNFSISLKEGNYVFAYEAKNNKYRGYYSKCALTTQANDCSTLESHKPIVVSVKSNTIINDISLCDYYYGQGEEPNF